MPKRLSQIGEFKLIDLMTRGLHAHGSVVKGVGDDTAVIDIKKKTYLLFTTDILMEGKHFTRRMSPVKIGRKALACSISDIAAMGGLPTYGVVSLGVPKSMSIDFVKKIYSGIERLAKKFHVSIVGGDTVASNKVIINVALLGEVKKNHLVTRKGARTGDMIFVTGPLGRSLKSAKHLTFTPRVKESQYLVKHFKPSAMIDISDGLSSDLTHILNKSKKYARLDYTKIPRTPGATLQNALNDGEDYELLFTLSKPQARRLMKVKNKGLCFYGIGEIVSKKNRDQTLKPRGYTHF